MIAVYIDGSFKQQPSKDHYGGIGYVIVKDEKIIQEKGEPVLDLRDPIEAEVQAITIALNDIIEKDLSSEQIEIYTDSQYLVDFIDTKLKSLVSSNWKTSTYKLNCRLSLI